MYKGVDWNVVVKTFELYRDELYVQVHGGQWKVSDEQTIQYSGIKVGDEMKELLMERAIKPETSYVALRDAQMLLARIQEVYISAQLVQVELRSTLNSATLPKAASAGSPTHSLKLIKEKISGYVAICKTQYDFMVEMLYSLNTINTGINRRFYEGNQGTIF